MSAPGRVSLASPRAAASARPGREPVGAGRSSFRASPPLGAQVDAFVPRTAPRGSVPRRTIEVETRATGEREAAAAAFRSRLPDVDGCDVDGLEAALALLEPHLPGEQPAHLHARVQRVLESRILDRVTRLHLLEKLSPSARQDILRALSSRCHEELKTAAGHPRSRAVNVDWSTIDFEKNTRCPTLEWAFSVLAGDAYAIEERDPFKAFAGLQAAGFELHKVGRSWDPSPAIVAVRDDVALVVHRGTWSPQGIAADLDVTLVSDFGGLVHRGFASVTRSSLPEVEGILARASEHTGRPIRTFLIGHSLGAAVATLSAIELETRPNVDVAGVYAYGCPKLMDPEGRERLHTSPLYERLYTVVNHGDGIPELPERPQYVPVGRHVYIDHDCVVHADLSADQVRARREAKPVRGGPLKKFFANHSTHTYSNALFLNKE